MSVSICHRHNYANVLINTENVISGCTVTGNTIPAMLKDGRLHYMPFGGVIDDDSIMKNAHAVKLVNVTGFWWNDMGAGRDGHTIPAGHAVKGYLLNDRYYIAIKNDKPLHWPLTQRPSRRKYG